MYIEILLDNLKNRPHSVFIGLCVFSVAIMGTSVHHAASTAFGLLFVTSVAMAKHWVPTWRILNRNEKLLLGAFSLYAVSGVLAYFNVQDVDEYIKDLERYLRFLLAIPIYLYARKHKVDVIRYLYAGAVVSGPFLLYVAISSQIEHPEWPARGYYHHIIFGSVAMLNVGVMLAVILTTKVNNYLKLLVFASMLCAFTAAIMSQSRGVWLVLPVYALITLYYSLHGSKAKLFALLTALTLITGILLTSPLGKMVSQRVVTAVDEVSDYYNTGAHVSSLGTRLAMWNIAIDVWQRHPIVGTGPGDFDEEVRTLQRKGEYVGMDIHESTHNIYFQSLVNAGIIGFITMMLALFFMPLKIILESTREKDATASLTGYVLIISFVIIGLSESWTLRLPMVSVFIIYLTVIITSLYHPDGKGKE